MLEGRIDADLQKLYALIWKRAVACQMIHAVKDTVAVNLLAGADGPGRHLLRANGSTLVKPGYMAVYIEGRDDSADDEDERILPAMEAGDRVELVSLRGVQHFTEPPPRFSEASLVKRMEELGIGRPSTYASTLAVLREREYIKIEKKRLHAEDKGMLVTSFLESFFSRYVEYDFTAALESDLDRISNSEIEWKEVLRLFWQVW